MLPLCSPDRNVALSVTMGEPARRARQRFAMGDLGW
jgi:hypothetical protein